MSADVFADDPQLQQRVNHALNDPNQSRLMVDITNYVVRLHTHIAHLTKELKSSAQPPVPSFTSNGLAQSQSQSQSIPDQDAMPPPKKRKLPEPDANDTDAHWKTGPPLLNARDVSFSIPMRKKLGLEIVGSTAGKEGGLRVVVQGSGKEIEAGIGFGDVEQVIAVPVPDKAQPTTNFCIIPTQTSSAECIVWTVPGTGIPKNWLYNGPNGMVPVQETYQVALLDVFDRELNKYGKQVVTPNEDEFVSNIVQAHRKGEKNWHVRAFLGSKEGYIYPLPNGLLFGFKKPLLLFSFADVTSISYTSVLQRTFNLVITSREYDQNTKSYNERDFEFSMLDQTDFAPLDAYVKRHGLNDASLAAGRRAQTVKQARGQARGQVANVDGAAEMPDEEESELAKAERELQDAEDEEEEDFDPSGGESDGSGSGYDSEEGDGDGGGHDDEDMEAEDDD